VSTRGVVIKSRARLSSRARIEGASPASGIARRACCAPPAAPRKLSTALGGRRPRRLRPGLAIRRMWSLSRMSPALTPSTPASAIPGSAPWRISALDQRVWPGGRYFDDENGRLPVAIRLWYPVMSYRERLIARCPAERSESRCSTSWHNSRHPETRGRSLPKHRIRSRIFRMRAPRTPEPNLGTLLYLISLGLVATATVVVFFGLGFFLLAHPSKGVTVDPALGTAASKSNPGGPILRPRRVWMPHPPPSRRPRARSPEKPLEAPDVSPPPRKGTTSGSASSADTVAANALDASSRQEQPELRSNTDEALAAMPAGVAHAAAHYKMAPRTGSIVPIN
jgi:hypothetical protein